MLIKSILVHVDGDVRYQERLRLAIDLAHRFDAHLTLAYALARADHPAPSIGRWASMTYLEEASQAALAKAEAVRSEVEAKCRSELRSWEWRQEQGEVERIVSRYANLADLAIVQQSPVSFFEDRVIFHMSDYLVISAGCPMLLVPEAWPGGAVVGSRVLIAWKIGREVIGAVRGALSFLQGAQDVMILAAADDRKADPPGSELAAYLSHHGVRARIIGTSQRGGEDILQTANAHGCDLIVMGAYAHPRLQELFLGGATDYVMRHTSMPVLMRH